MESGDFGVFFENRLDNLSLNTYSTAMDDPDLSKPPFQGLVEIFLHHDLDFSRLKSVQINRVLDRDLVHSVQYNGRL